MIELHSHILPNLDDGARSLDDALLLLQDYISQGVRMIVCTPHLYSQDMSSESALIDWLEARDRRLAELQAAAKLQSYDISLLAGAEIILNTAMLPILKHSDFAARVSLNSSSYLLVELPHTLSGGLSSLEGLLFQIQLTGYMPILAHPERTAHNPGVMKVLQEWVDSDRVLLQVNAGHLADDPRLDPERQARYQRRRKISVELIQRNMVQFVASDAHDPLTRPCQHHVAYTEIQRVFAQETADRLFNENPARVVNDQAVLR